MQKRLIRINLIRLFFLVVLVTSLVLTLVFAFSWRQAVFSSVVEKTSETVYSEDIILIFSSLKSSYMPGETATFYIDILNLREFPISRVDFSLNVKALSLFGLDVLFIEDYSTRTFETGEFVRIIFERSLPAITPPGFFTLDLSARPSILKAPPKASITICVKPSTSIIVTPLTALASSSAIYTLLILGAYLDVGKLPKNPALRGLASFAYSSNIKSEEINGAFKKTYINFSVGQKFVFLGICALIIASFPLIIGLERFANDLAILAYFSLTTGVVNLLWETLKRKTTNLKLNPSLRLMLSLTILGLLTYLSNNLLNKILGIAILAFMSYMAIRVKLRS